MMRILNVCSMHWDDLNWADDRVPKHDVWGNQADCACLHQWLSDVSEQIWYLDRNVLVALSTLAFTAWNASHNSEIKASGGELRVYESRSIEYQFNVGGEALP